MKKQVFVIGGGEAFDTRDQYLDYLRAQEVDPYEEPVKGWKHTLAEQLGEEYITVFISMPSKMNAKYEEWQIWFEKYIPFIQDGDMLLGHSLGAMFLARYLSEHTLSVDILKLVLVSGECIKETEEGEEFYVQNDEGFEKLNVSAEEIFIVHSVDDPVVPYRHAELFAERIPRATLVSFADQGHFLQPEFPELVEIIKQ